MMLVEFDSVAFCDAVAAKIAADKRLRGKALRETGIPVATFQRMVAGPAIRNIDAILSAAAFFDLRLVDFVKVAARAEPLKEGL